MKERARCGPGPPLLFAVLAVVRVSGDKTEWSTQADPKLSWLSLESALGAIAGAPSRLPECTSPMTRSPEPVAVEGSVADQHLVSRDEGKARFQGASFAIRRPNERRRAPPCTALASAPPHPG